MSTTKTDTPRPSQQRFYTMKQLAERWQRNKRSIDRDIKNGDLTVHKFGKSIRISEDDITIYEAINRKKKF